MKLHVLLLLLFEIVSIAHAVDYKGTVYVKKTGIDDVFLVELNTRLIFESQKSVLKQSTDMLKQNFIYKNTQLGRRVLDGNFAVFGALVEVRLHVVEKDSSSQQTVCDKEIPSADISLGTNVFKCMTNSGSGGNDTKWIFYLVVKKS